MRRNVNKQNQICDNSYSTKSFFVWSILTCMDIYIRQFLIYMFVYGSGIHCLVSIKK